MIPKIVVTVALMAVQMALQASQKIKGPRLDSTKTTTADYGTPIPRFWGQRKFECPIIHAEDLRETQHTSKGKAGKNTQYKYFATFDALICDHPIDAVTKIRMDDKLVYQATAAGPVSIGAAAGLSVGGTMRIYLGTETQEADPRYVTWCEDRYGPDSAPALRGSAHIFFEELPVNNFGNRIPNITVEAVSSKTDAFPYETAATGLTLFDAAFSSDGTFMLMRNNSGDYEVWDVPTRTRMIVGAAPVSIGGRPGIDSDGNIWSVRAGGAWIDEWTLTGALVTSIAPGFAGAIDIRIIAGVVFVVGTLSTTVHYVSGGAVVSVAVPFTIHSHFTDGDNVWVAGNSGTTLGFYCVLGLRATDLVSLTSPTASSASMQACNPGAGQFVCEQNGDWYLVDDVAGTASTPVALGIAASADDLERVVPGDISVWVDWSEISFSGPALVRTVNPLDWASGSTDRPIYDRLNHAIIADDAGTPLMWRFLDRIAAAGVTLKTIVDDVSEWCGLTTQDTSALTQIVTGYSVTQGSGKQMISPLLDIYDVDPRPHDFTVQFVNRGSSSTGTILTEDFVRGDSRYKVTIQQDTDLPRKLTFNFADNDHDQQPNNVISQRPLDAVDTTREDTIDLSTFADTPDGAQQKADRYFRRAWNSREKIVHGLTAQYLALEPGDVKTLSLDGRLVNARLEKLTISPASLDCEWVRDETSFAVLNSATGPSMDARDAETIFIPAPTKGFFIDAPLVQDADNDINPLIYLGAGSYGGTWPGAIDYRGDDPVLSVDSTSGATWGYATTELTTANPNLWDRGNTLSVTIFGTLSSVTEAEIDADDTLNLIAIGADDRWEYLNFATATLTGTSGTANTYTLSDFKRGRRGTEINVANHESGDVIVLVSALAPYEMGTDAVGDVETFKAQTFGRDPDSAPSETLTFDGNTLKPYAPARIIWTTDGTDMFGEIIRRTRVGGSWVGGSTIPLSENSEAYEVDVYNGATFKRTITATGTNTFTYTAAQIAADGNTVGVTPPFNAYQMSDTVGRGFALAA